MVATMSSQFKSEARQGRRLGRKREAKKRKKTWAVGKSKNVSSVHLFFLGIFLFVGNILVGNSSVMVAAQGSNNDESLPFLTDSDISCMASTTDFIEQNPKLAATHATFEDSKILVLYEKASIEIFEYPLDSANEMKGACEMNDGMWASVKSMAFTCVKDGMETIPLQVQNFGRCLEKTADCIEANAISLLKAKLSGLGYNCWEKGGSPIASDEDGAAADSENNSVPFKIDKDVEVCMDSTTTFLQQDPKLASAIETFQDSQTLYTDKESGIEFFQYPLESATSMGMTCQHNGGLWLLIKFMDLKCTINSLENMPLQVYNFGRCLAKTDDCIRIDTTNMLKSELYGLGYDCSEDEGSDSDVDIPVDIPANDKADSETYRLPFLTDEDVACMAYTTAFIEQNSGLASASKTFQHSYRLSWDEETGIEKLTYKLESANEMKAACAQNSGIRANVQSIDLTCDSSGVGTMKLQVNNFEACLSPNQDCKAMDNITLLRSELADLRFNCWDGASSPTDSVVDTWNSEGNVEESTGQEKDSMQSLDGASSPTDSEGSESDVDIPVDIPANDKADSEIYRLPFLTDEDVACMASTTAFIEQNPGLASATKTFQDSHLTYLDEKTGIEKFEYSLESANEMKAACAKNSGIRAYVQSIDLTCDISGVGTMKLQVKNFEACLSPNQDCKAMDDITVLKLELADLGFNCRDGAPSSTTDVPGINGDNKENHLDNPLFKELRLTQSEAFCMASSIDFIENSLALSNATSVYEKSAEMSDPTKLVFSKASTTEMEQVCGEQGGRWTYHESVDFTCAIEGSNKCINAYNFGNCIANNDDCEIMDPVVFVEAFFLEVMKMSCRAGCDQLKDTSWHSPTPAPQMISQTSPPYSHSSNGNNLSAQQSTDSSETKPSSFTVPAVLLSALAAILFIGFYRRRASGRSKMAYETAEISDLGCRTIT